MRAIDVEPTAFEAVLVIVCPHISLVVEGPTTGTVDCCLEHKCQTPVSSHPPRADTLVLKLVEGRRPRGLF